MLVIVYYSENLFPGSAYKNNSLKSAFKHYTTHGAMLTISTSAYYAYCLFLITHSFFAISIIKELITGYCSGALFSHYAVVNKAEHVCDRSQHYIIVYVVMNAEKHYSSIKDSSASNDPHTEEHLSRESLEKTAKSS